MAIEPRALTSGIEPDSNRWRGLYKLGALSALATAPLLVGEVAVYAVLPRPATALAHFSLFRESWLAGLLYLDLLGMIAYLFLVPTILAIYMAARHDSEAVAILGTVLFLLGVASFFASNTAFSVLDLSNRYAAAGTEADRAMYLSAGQAMFTLFNENAFLVSYVIVSGGWTLISVAMLRGRLFGRLTSYAGILAGVGGIAAVALEHVAGGDVLLWIAIVLYFLALVSLLGWVGLSGWRLYRLGRVSDSDSKPQRRE